MIVYNITIAIDLSAEDDWVQWMKQEHIPEVMDTGKFTEFKFFRVMAKQDEEAASYSVQFYAESMKELQLYMAIDAPELQQKTAQRWPDKFAAFRTVLQSVD